MTVVLYAETVTDQQSNDDGSGAKTEVMVYRSTPNVIVVGNLKFPHYFGQVATNGSPATVFRVHFSSSLDYAKVPSGPDNWEQFWTDKGSNKSSDYTLWKIKDAAIPPGFKCLSPFFFQRANNRPAPTAAQVRGMVFVADHLCKPIDPTQFVMGWSSLGTRALNNVSMAFAKDNIGYVAMQTLNPIPPTGTWYTLDFNKDEVRLVQDWDQLDLSVLAATSVDLYPRRTVNSAYVLSMNKDFLTSVYNGNLANFKEYENNTYDCEDFAADMRAAVARACRNDPLCVDLQAGCFCGMVYLVDKTNTDEGHGQNMYLQADGTCAIFEPQDGTFETLDQCKQKYDFNGVCF